MRITFIYLAGIFLLLALACQKEENTGEIFFRSACMADYKMPFTDADLTTNFVDAQTSRLGPLRLISGLSGNSWAINIWQTVATSGPTLELNGNYPVQKLVMTIGDNRQPLFPAPQILRTGKEMQFNLEKYSKKFFSSIETMVDSSFHEGPLILNKSMLSPDTTKTVEENFVIVMLIGDCEIPGSWFGCLSAIPEQNGALNCDKFLKTYEGDSIRYVINLSFDNITMQRGPNFQMNDGKMSLDFKIRR